MRRKGTEEELSRAANGRYLEALPCLAVQVMTVTNESECPAELLARFVCCVGTVLSTRLPRTNYYRVSKKGYLVMTTALRCREAKLPELAA